MSPRSDEQSVSGAVGLPGHPAKRWANRVLERVHLRKPLGRVHVTLRHWGLAPWQPLVPAQRFSACVDNALAELRQTDPSHQIGDYLEFGVSRGTSMAAVYHVLQKNDFASARLIGFDSFAGMPPESASEGWEPGAYASPIGLTRRHLRSKGVDLGKVTLVKGWFSDTLNETTRSGLQLGKASLIMVDCDIYTASKEALAFSAQHIHDRAIMIFDDWGWREQDGQPGQKEAFAEFLAEHPGIKADPLPSYLEQARVFMLTRWANALKLIGVVVASTFGLEFSLEAV